MGQCKRWGKFQGGCAAGQQCVSEGVGCIAGTTTASKQHCHQSAAALSGKVLLQGVESGSPPMLAAHVLGGDVLSEPYGCMRQVLPTLIPRIN